MKVLLDSYNPVKTKLNSDSADNKTVSKQIYNKSSSKYKFPGKKNGFATSEILKD
jgi:hypothetical protein